MIAISEAQIEFETLERVVRAGSATLDLTPVAEELDRIEAILGELITEWETVLNKAVNGRVERRELEKLDLFLARPTESNRRFERGFAQIGDSFLQIQELISRQLLS
jgi:hypothetical protein